MALKTTLFDTVDYLKTDADRFGYLTACLQEVAEDPGAEDAAFIAHAIGDVARSGNMSQLARDTGLTREGLYKAFSVDGNPSFATVWKVLHALGFRFEISPIKHTASKRPPAKKKQAATGRIAAKRAPRAATKPGARNK